MSTLAERLRSGTRVLHTAAERTPFMLSLLRGHMERPAYVDLLLNLSAIYEVLEPALAAHADHPALAPLPLEALARSSALRADLSVLGPTSAELRPATRAYVQRLQEVAVDRPELLLAHAYVRYLGDLSGGQLLRRLVAGSSRLAAADAVSFYDFGDANRVAQLSRDFRAGLDLAAVEHPELLVAEAISSFEGHRRLFEELGDAHGSDAGTGDGVGEGAAL